MNRLLLCGLAGVVIAGCSSGHTDVGSRTEDAASKPPSARVTTVASPARTVTFARLKQAVVQIANADGIVAVAGGLWVKTDDGRAVRVDPATNKITTQVSLDHVSDRSDYCQGIGTDGKTVWACATENDGTALAQIEPASAHVLRRVKIGKLFDQLSLPATARGIWALTGDGATVRVVDPSTGRTTSYPLGAVCQQLATDGDRLIATGSVANVAVVINARTGAVVGRVPLRSPRVAAVLGGDAWRRHARPIAPGSLTFDNDFHRCRSWGQILEHHHAADDRDDERDRDHYHAARRVGVGPHDDSGRADKRDERQDRAEHDGRTGRRPCHTGSVPVSRLDDHRLA